MFIDGKLESKRCRAGGTETRTMGAASGGCVAVGEGVGQILRYEGARSGRCLGAAATRETAATTEARMCAAGDDGSFRE